MTRGSIWTTGQYACGSKRNWPNTQQYIILLSDKTIWPFFKYRILADVFVLNLKMWKNSRCLFSYWFSTIYYEVMRPSQGTRSASNSKNDPWKRTAEVNPNETFSFSSKFFLTAVAEKTSKGYYAFIRLLIVKMLTTGTIQFSCFEFKIRLMWLNHFCLKKQKKKVFELTQHIDYQSRVISITVYTKEAAVKHRNTGSTGSSDKTSLLQNRKIIRM